MYLIKAITTKKTIESVYPENDVNKLIKTMVKDYICSKITKTTNGNNNVYYFKSEDKLIYITKISTNYKIAVYDFNSFELYSEWVKFKDTREFISNLLTKIINL